MKQNFVRYQEFLFLHMNNQATNIHPCDIWQQFYQELVEDIMALVDLVDYGRCQQILELLILLFRMVSVLDVNGYFIQEYIVSHPDPDVLISLYFYSVQEMILC